MFLSPRVMMVGIIAVAVFMIWEFTKGFSRKRTILFSRCWYITNTIYYFLFNIFKERPITESSPYGIHPLLYEYLMVFIVVFGYAKIVDFFIIKGRGWKEKDEKTRIRK